MAEAPDKTELLKFPCHFPVKAIGHAQADIPVIVKEIIDAHVEPDCILDLQERESGKGKYTAVTVTIHAQSKQQLDKIYQALTDHESVVFAI